MGASLALVDVAVTNPLADSYADAESREPGFALRRTEEDKKKRYGSKSSVRDMQFFPLVLSTFGTLGVDSLTFLRKVATFTSDAPGFMRHMCMALSIAVHTGNARILLAAKENWWHFGVR